MTGVTAARLAWEEGNRRFEEEARDARHAPAMHAQRDALVEELRRRVGTTFTLSELADAYDGAERWLLEVVEERVPAKGWVRTAAVAGDAAFHAYSRQAQDYAP
ncbi:MAG: hypothetical protein M5U27_16050 [Gaiella sp.]|nr:hypothetical protein [Gaiella sp.]